tara:strand:- start:13001 stop:14338 length:1338 start_codon:yes stop_codon:yes gene_type:complete
MNLNLSELASYLSVTLYGKDIHINKIVTDSRNIKKGNLFVAISGEKFNGHDFIPEAIQKGAVAIICEDEKKLSDFNIPYIVVDDAIKSLGTIASHYKKKLGDPFTIGITGTNGKTTVTKLTHSILSKSFNVSTTIGNFNNEIGLPLSILDSDNIHTIQKCVYELGASKINDIKYLSDICRPNLTTLLNVSEAHLETFGNMNNLVTTKEEIFSNTNTTHVVLNIDDAYFEKWKKINNKRKITTISLTKNADYFVKLSDIHNYIISTPKGEIKLDKNKTKSILAINILFSIALALEAGSNINDVAKGIYDYSGIEGRFYKFVSSNKSLVIDDSYNANPESMKSALYQLSKARNTRLFIMGDMGELADKSYDCHLKIFNLVKKLGIEYFFYMGNFSKEAQSIFGQNCYTFTNLMELITETKKLSDERTTILIKASRYMNFDIIARELR